MVSGSCVPPVGFIWGSHGGVILVTSLGTCCSCSCARDMVMFPLSLGWGPGDVSLVTGLGS